MRVRLRMLRALLWVLLAAGAHGHLQGAPAAPKPGSASALALRGGEARSGSTGAGGGDVASAPEPDLADIRRAVEDMQRRIPTDEELAAHCRVPVPLDADPQAESALRQILQSFQVTAEGNDHARRGQVEDGGTQGGEGCGEEEDEYGPIALHAAVWQDISPEPRVSEVLASVLPSHLLPTSSLLAETPPFWRRELAATGALATAATWPENCGAHLVRGIPEVDHPPPMPVLNAAAAAHFDSPYYRQRMLQLLELVATDPLEPGLCEVAAFVSLVLPVSTTARLFAALNANRNYFLGFWSAGADRRLQAHVRAFVCVASRCDAAVAAHVESLGGGLEEAVQAWFGSLCIGLFPPSERVAHLDRLFQGGCGGALATDHTGAFIQPGGSVANADNEVKAGEYGGSQNNTGGEWNGGLVHLYRTALSILHVRRARILATTSSSALSTVLGAPLRGQREGVQDDEIPGNDNEVAALHAALALIKTKVSREEVYDALEQAL